MNDAARGTITVWVPRDQAEWFDRHWNTGEDVTRDHATVRGQKTPAADAECSECAEFEEDA